MPPAVKRFLKYSFVGVSTFLFDLLFLFLLIDVLLVNYIVATGLAFLVAVSINYCISRKYVFKGTVRPFKIGYIIFISSSLLSLLIIISCMYVMVEILAFNYLVSRISIAGITGFGNYVLNLVVNFKVKGMHY